MDPKPILDLLTEFKAEIVEEEITDMDDVSRILLELFLPFLHHFEVLPSQVTAKICSNMICAFDTREIFSTYLCFSNLLLLMYVL